MKDRLKQYILIAVAAAALYFVLDNHFIISGYQVRTLKKAEMNLHDTFVSLDNKRPESVLKNDRLREAGIGDLLVEFGMISEEKKTRLENKFDYDE
ncbi:MAG: hypothetical protein KJO34_12965 [Deltaproteobacteria bacterium]|nr:hypothetical protein [Deltaproteobacteria bacterium]